MKSYLELINKIQTIGTVKGEAREGQVKTIGISHANLSFDLSEGFPLVTTREIHFKSIVVELLWFLKGDTNIKYLVDNGCNIWNKDAYRWFKRRWKLEYGSEDYPTIETFVQWIKDKPIFSKPYFKDGEFGPDYWIGDLGKVYGYQWRSQNGHIDQVSDIIEGFATNPYSRYHIMDGWNKEEFKDMALPPCHLLYQFVYRKEYHGTEYLDLNLYQRSCDTVLGVPFNIASASLMLMVFAKLFNCRPGVLYWTGGDTHIYSNHIEPLREQLRRQPLPLSRVDINKEINCLADIESLEPSDIVLSNYSHHSKINYELNVGV